MIPVRVTFDTALNKWVIYHGWVHMLNGTADQVNEWLEENKLKYVEVRQ